METIIEVKDITTRFGTNVVHEGLNLHVNRGEIYGLLGPSGCGKTTLMKEMVLLQEYQKGNINVLGYDLNKIGHKDSQTLRQEWGMLFQFGALYSSLSVYDNIAVSLREYTNISETLIDDIVSYKIDIVGLNQSAKKLFPSQISGGMRKKAALARALVMDPKLLFLDEPTSGLDPISAREFDALILRLRERFDLSIVMVTHDLDSIKLTVDRAAILDEKKVAAEGSIEEIKAIENKFIETFFKGH
ncbi:MAG: ATP-binding cassette domain-containing protein [Campylobacterota bacterium]|nr:ATP-binding cassette domain-containing protein [Campylobacterota bacterium]